jgi:glycosyltransferase involved in cell wall biosynthesis
MTRVVYWTNIPAPYMVDRFNAIAARKNMDFEAWFSARTEDDRSWSVNEESWNFRWRYLPKVKVGGQSLAFAPELLGGAAPDLLVGLHADPGFLVSHYIGRARGTRIVLWVTPTYDAWIQRRRWKEAVKHIVFSHADAIFTTGSDGRRAAERYRSDRRQVFVLPHSVDCSYLTLRLPAAAAQRSATRAELSIRGVTFLYVGRLWSGKGLDYLVDAFRTFVSTTGLETTLVLAGDGPDEARLRRRALDEGLHVIFPGFHQRDRLARIYAAADIFVFPTLGDPFGHVVEEAMSCGLPVISTSAAGEIGDRIHDGRDGFIVPPRDSRALFERMQLLAADGSLRSKVGRAASGRAAGRTADHWAREFEAAVEAVLSLP